MTVGKVIGDAKWVHKSCISFLPPEEQAQVNRAKTIAERQGFQYDVVKLTPNAVSFLRYPDFFTSTNPALVAGMQVSGGEVDVREYGQNGNPPLLHRHYEMLSETHEHYEALKARFDKQQKSGYFDKGVDLSRIGTLQGHQERVRQARG